MPSNTCPSETLEGDVLGVVKFGFSGWGAKINGVGVGEICIVKEMVVMVFVVVVTKFHKLEEFL